MKYQCIRIPLTYTGPSKCTQGKNTSKSRQSFEGSTQSQEMQCCPVFTNYSGHSSLTLFQYTNTPLLIQKVRTKLLMQYSRTFHGFLVKSSVFKRTKAHICLTCSFYQHKRLAHTQRSTQVLCCCRMCVLCAINQLSLDCWKVPAMAGSGWFHQ